MVGKTIGELLNQGVKLLKESNIETPILDAQLILAKILKVDKLFVMTNINQEVSDSIEKKFINDILLRTKGMPVQYIIGSQEFMGLEFKVNNCVLIPRADTEILIEQVLQSVKSDKEYKILDIGTGSGCISISLAKYIKDSQIYSADISKSAIEVAGQNAKTHNVEDKIKFFVGNIFEPIGNNIKFDIIVSNPPYIPTDTIQTLDVNVKQYEPGLALDGGADGLDFYRDIISNAKNYLVSEGMIFLEIGYDQAQSVIKLLKQNDFADINIVKDLAGCDRVVKAKTK